MRASFTRLVRFLVLASAMDRHMQHAVFHTIAFLAFSCVAFSVSPSTETSVCKQSGLVVYVWAATFQFFPCLHFFPSPLSFPLLFLLFFSTFCLPRIGPLAEEASFDLYPTLCFKKIRRVSPKIRKGRPTSHWNFRRSVL